MRRFRSRVVIASLAVAALQAVALQGQPPVIDPITSKAHNIQGQFTTINDHGTPSGFTRGTIDPDVHEHYQGISRHPTRPDVFFLSKSGDASSPPAVMGVRLPGEASTRQMNHNLWAMGKNTTHETGTNGYASTYWEETLGSDCLHFGGLQASGEVLAVASEKCNGGSHGSKARVHFFHVHNRLWPVAIDVNADGGFGLDSVAVGFQTAGAVGIIEDSPGFYTVMVFTDGNTRVQFRQFKLDVLTLTATSSWKTYFPPSNQSNGWERGSGAHQALNLVRQDDDTLFAIGTQRGVFQSDYMFLYQVSGLDYDANGHLIGHPNLLFRAKRKMYCTNWENSGSRMCDFQATGGIYVARAASGNRNGELIILAGAHDDDKGPNSNLAPITEFRNRNVRVIDNSHGDCGTSSWATLYDDDHMDGDRNITITEHNSALDDFKHLHESTIDFGDKASAISYCIRPGCTMTAYKHSGYSSPLITISGAGTFSGRFGFDNDLKRSSGGAVGTNWSGMGDEISSIKITCP